MKYYPFLWNNAAASLTPASLKPDRQRYSLSLLAALLTCPGMPAWPALVLLLLLAGAGAGDIAASTLTGLHRTTR